jgi:beta-lactamase regulating signal transducer with metallopeptidase domain
VHLLLSWLWQGGLLALTAAALLLCIPRSRAQTRYWFVWVACLAVLVLPLMPYVSAAAAPQPSRGHVLGSIGPIVSVPAAWWTSPTAVLGLWAIWVTVCVVRLSIAVGEVRNARRHIRECPPDVHDRLRHWLRVRSTGRRSRLVLSSHVRSAAVFGCGSPVIAVSPRLLQTLRDQDLDRVVVHEWAHVQRRDDIAQIVQSVVRIVAGWHPAVWWLERRLTLEREVACDHVVVRVTGSAKEYAACLLTLATLPRRASRSVHALAGSSASWPGRRPSLHGARERRRCLPLRSSAPWHWASGRFTRFRWRAPRALPCSPRPQRSRQVKWSQRLDVRRRFGHPNRSPAGACERTETPRGRS